MNDARQREKDLFAEALEIVVPLERAAFLEKVCMDDPVLRRRLEQLLAAQGPAELFLTPPPAPGAGDPEAIQAEADHLLRDSLVLIGRYKLLRRLGAGGCGVVYLAEQQEPVRRLVALKIIRLGMDTESVVARFELERQALALMDHPHIARVLDAGATASGRLYFAMELVEGIRITDYCAQNRLTIAQRLELFIQVCLAIQHAHQKGIIHRDIKPSNILVATLDGNPVPKVIDFGIAKAVESRLGEHIGLTTNVHLIGTPAYMSPEQADLGNPDLDTRSDIYSLGVLLHELLTGRTPVDPRELESAGLETMRRILREREIPRPSSVLASLSPAELRAVAEQRRLDPARLPSVVRGDLDWIVATALEKDRRRRYETANGLALDIRRHLSNEMVSARPPSRVYRLRKLVRRNRAVFVAGLLILLTLLAGLGTSTWLLLREREARREQTRLLALAEAGEKIAQAAVLLSYGKTAEADALVADIPEPLLRPSLECARVLRDLGEWHAVADRWDAAALRYYALARVITRVDASDSDNVSFSLMPAASALREQGDLARYDAFRREAVARFASTGNPLPAEQILKASLLAPASPDLLAGLVPLAEIVAATLREPDPTRGADAYLQAWRCFVLALHSERRGDAEGALRWGERSLAYANLNEPREISVRMTMAMALRRLGRVGEARALVEGESAAIADHFLRPQITGSPTPQGWIFWFDWINARLLWREAAALTSQ
jgi:serine/threonine protein kinase